MIGRYFFAHARVNFSAIPKKKKVSFGLEKPNLLGERLVIRDICI
jgi:hypothetical protein